MKQYLFILTAIAVAAIAQAQNTTSSAPSTSNVSQSSGNQGSPIVIVNKIQGSQESSQSSGQSSGQSASQGSVQEQPATLVESNPLADSKAEKMRKARLSVEADTESKIVEKLESARIDDEKARQDRVLAAPFSSAQEQNQTPANGTAASADATAIVVTPGAEAASGAAASSSAASTAGGTGASAATASSAAASTAAAPQPAVSQTPAASQTIVQPIQVVPVQVQPQPVPEAAPAPTPVPVAAPTPEPTAPPQGEMRANADQDKHEDEDKKYYVGGTAGYMNYSSRTNIQNNGAAGGVVVGYHLQDHLVLEGGFLYSGYQITTFQPGTGYSIPPLVNLSQYNFLGELKYEFGNSRFRPFVGGLLSYTYRNYTDGTGSGYYSYSYDTNTNAVDGGFTVGADFYITKRFTIGADFKYLTNVYTTNGNNNSAYGSYGLWSYSNPLEKIDYSSLQATLKYTF